MRSASPCAHCKPREHAHERRRTTDLARRRAAQGDRRAHATRRILRSPAQCTPRSSTARSRMAGRCRSTPRPPEKAPGVLAVFTHRNMPRMNPTPKPWSHLHPHGQSYLPLQDDQIHYAGQPIALVVADTLDQATHAGTLIEVEYEAHPPAVFDLRDGEGGRRRSSAIPVAGRVIGRRCREGNRRRRSQDRADLHHVRPASQPDGAARDDGGLGRRRHADAL